MRGLVHADSRGLTAAGRASAWALAAATIVVLAAILAASADRRPLSPPEPLIWRSFSLAVPPPPPPPPKSRTATPPDDPSVPKRAAAPLDRARPLLVVPAGEPARAAGPVEGLAASAPPSQAVVPLSAPLASRIARAAECYRLDPRERPPDCPPEPVSRPDNRPSPRETPPPTRREQVLSRAENSALRFAGYREPCETNSGLTANTCLRFGAQPAVPRTPQEHCERAGLGGPCDPPPQRPAPAPALPP